MAEQGVNRTDLTNAANPNAPFVSLTAVNPRTIVLKLKYPLSYTMAVVAYGTGIMPILPKETDSTFNVRGDQIGTGPFVFDSYQPSVAFKYKFPPAFFIDRKEPVATNWACAFVEQVRAELAS